MCALKLAYVVLTGGLLVVTAAAYAVGSVTIRAPEAALFGGASAYLLAHGTLIAYLRPSQRWLRVVGAAEQATGAWLLPLLLTLLASAALTPWTGAPVDALLATPERWLGLTQADAAAWAERCGLLPVLVAVYGSLAVQGRAACAYWSLWRQDTRPLWEVATGFAACTAVCLPLYVLLPAEGPWVYYGSTSPMPAWLCDWLAMRAGPYVLARLDGFISAPSYHAVFAVMLTYVWWRSPLRLGALVVNLLMLGATWVVGHHYLSDLALGVSIAGVALVLVQRWGGR